MNFYSLFYFISFILFYMLVPTEKSIILKENFNRWYSVRSYYISTTLIDLPVTIISCLLFSIVIYIMVGWPLEADRFSVFFVVSFLIVFIAQTIGLLIGTVCNVIVSILLCILMNLTRSLMIIKLNIDASICLHI